MSLKAELETWAAALKAYDEEDFEKSLELFNAIADSSKILTNMGLIYATLGEHEVAVENFNAATALDQYLAVAYFQCGVSNFLLTRYELALKDFEEALLYLRGNQAIDYEQIGLKFKLYSAEVLFNKGLSQIYLGRTSEGLQDMENAFQEKATEEHNVIDDAIADRGEGYTVFSIPVGVLYRPSENKIKNARTKDYLGKAKLVAASDSREAYTTFTGVTRLQQGITPTGAPLDRPASDPGADRPLGRSVTTVPRDAPPGSAPPLLRNATSINFVSTDERQGRPKAAAPSSAASSAASAVRPNPVAKPGGVPGRPTVRTPIGGPGPSRTQSPDAGGRSPSSQTQQDTFRQNLDDPSNNSRLAEIYDDYIDGYNEAPPEVPPLPPMPREGNKRVAAWAHNNANPAVRRTTSSASPYGAPPSSYAPSNFGGSSARRKMSRRPTYATRSTGSGGRIMYEEEEEGYVSGDYDDGPFELVKIRIKLHYKDDVRGMALVPEMPFDEFLDRVTSKFNKSFNGLGLKFKDEDGTFISLRDDSDYDLAIETARESARGKPEGKLEVWCTDQ